MSMRFTRSPHRTRQTNRSFPPPAGAMYETRLRRYCSSGDPGANGGAASVTRPGSESSPGGYARTEWSLEGFHVFATIANAAAIYEPPETAARYFTRWRRTGPIACRTPRLKEAERIPPPEQQMP